MVRIITLLLALCVVVITVSAQRNMTFISNFDYDEGVTDVWGHVTPDGIEYALIGTTEGFSIVSLADPTQPEELQFIPGQSTSWRDIKTWGEFAYVVSDNTSEGLLIVDMSTLPQDTAVWQYWTGPITELNEFLLNSHNIYIDEYGLAYLAGSNLGAIVSLDVKQDPWSPVFIAQTPGPYAHDVFVRDSVVYASEIYRGEISGYDMKDTSNIFYLGGAQTPFQFTHNAWLSDDSKTVYTTDERSNAFIGSYDISNWNNVVELDRWRPAATEGRGVIPHNVHVLNDYLVISYYSDGVIIVDAANPDNLVEVGNYDTWSGADGGFNGAWGAYPFLPSGKVLVSDRSTGLYVLEPNYVRACYLEGVVTDAETGDPILNAVVNISSAEAISDEFTNISGEYKMGKADAGTFYVSASHPEYNTDSVEATFENGVLTVADIQLEPRARHTISGVVLGTVEIGPVPGANVIIENDAFSYITKANSNGIYSIPDIFEGSYRMYAGVWGEYEIMEVDVDASESLDVLIKPGYYDDFTFDYGWEVTTTASQGAWVREEPILETYFGFDCNPGEDLPDDFGKNAFMTGNIGGDARDNSVENGLTLISSPAMNLSLAGTAVLECQPWMCTRFPDVPSYFILATNGTDTAYLDTIFGTFDFGYWRDPQLYSLENYLELTEDVKVHFLAENPGEDNMVKAAIDGVSVTVSLSTSTEEPDLAAGSFSIYPNPARDEVTLDLRGYEQVNAFRVLDNLGRQILNVDLGSATDNHTFSVDWPAGMYFVQLESDQQIIATSKLIVTD